VAVETGLTTKVLVGRWVLVAAGLAGSVALSALAPAPRRAAPGVPPPQGATAIGTATGSAGAAPSHTGPSTAGVPGFGSANIGSANIGPANIGAAQAGPAAATMLQRTVRTIGQRQVPPVPPPRAKADCRVHRCVALTFDDGPVPGTARLLDILRIRGVRATFFVLGSQVAAHPGLLQREFAEGHEIGNHSYTHADLCHLPGAGARAEMGRTQQAVRRVTGRTPVLFRPPYGATDARVAAVARRNHLAQIMWAVDPLDWRDRDPALIERRVVRGTRRGSIILLHDIHPTTVSAVPGIIGTLNRRGYVFVTVSELYGGRRLAPGREYPRR
jgi:peptidoglycan/xylan/chitin deacetylase (PgdA/CDA1 family)